MMFFGLNYTCGSPKRTHPLLPLLDLAWLGFELRGCQRASAFVILSQAAQSQIQALIVEGMRFFGSPSEHPNIWLHWAPSQGLFDNSMDFFLDTFEMNHTHSALSFEEASGCLLSCLFFLPRRPNQNRKRSGRASGSPGQVCMTIGRPFCGEGSAGKAARNGTCFGPRSELAFD